MFSRCLCMWWCSVNMMTICTQKVNRKQSNLSPKTFSLCEPFSINSFAAWCFSNLKGHYSNNAGDIFLLLLLSCKSIGLFILVRRDVFQTWKRNHYNNASAYLTASVWMLFIDSFSNDIKNHSFWISANWSLYSRRYTVQLWHCFTRGELLVISSYRRMIYFIFSFNISMRHQKTCRKFFFY